MNIDSIGKYIWQLDPFLVYGFAIFLTLLVISNRTRLVTLPRPLVLFSWYAVIAIAVSWLLFHFVYLLSHDSRDVGLAVIARILQFSPVYLCALIVLFMYPKKIPVG